MTDTWNRVDPLVGPQGPQGPQGPPGPRAGGLEWFPMILGPYWAEWNAEGPFGRSEYCKDMTGRVWLRGLPALQTPLAAGAESGVPVTEMPPGFRPFQRLLLPAQMLVAAGTGGSAALCRVTIYSDGRIVPLNLSIVQTTAPAWLSIADINYFADGD